MGEFLKETPDAPTGPRPKELGNREVPNSRPPTLEEIGITKNQSARAQKLAALTDEESKV